MKRKIEGKRNRNMIFFKSLTKTMPEKSSGKRQNEEKEEEDGEKKKKNRKEVELENEK